jgi:hypothetical protein
MANLSNINNILRTGSLGVGINRDPLGAFEISSATKPGIKMFNTAASGKTYEAYSDANGNYIIYDQDADDNRFVINTSGNATFAGNINAASDSFKYELDSSGNALLDLSSTGGQQIRFFDTNSSYTEAMRILRFDDKLSITYGDNANEEALTVVGTGSSAGNVGIGETSPGSKLQIKGNGAVSGLTFKTTDSSSNETFYINDGGTVGVRYYPFKIGVPSGTANVANSRFQIATTAGDFVVLNDGKTGIGTQVPSAKLEVVTAVGADAIRLNYGQSADIFLGFNSTNPRVLLQDNSNVVTHNFQSNGDNYIVGSNVGIGISTPYSKLQVNGGANTFCTHFGGQYNTDGHYQGISLGYAENANAAYRKVAIVAQATGDGAARQNLLFLVDGASDSNSASIADNKMILNYDGAIKIGNGSNIAINTNGGHYHAAGPSGLSMRQYQYYVDIPNGSTIDLFKNSSAYSDLQMTKISIVMYHSSRTYFAGMGCVGGYGFNLTGAGSGLANGGLTSAVVSTGIRKLQIANNSGFTAAARIFIEIMADSGVIVLNGGISAPY